MEPFVGEIRAFAFNKIPNGWAACNGQLLQLNQYQALYALIGTTYGGTPGTNFNLPNLNGVTMVNYGNAQTGTSYVYGKTVGTSTVQLTIAQTPLHTHNYNVANGSGTATLSTTVAGNELSATQPNILNQTTDTINLFVPPAPVPTLVPLTATTITGGGNGAHNNMMPYLPVTLCIALTGIFPMRN
ncbi:phage tail protein [Mucilaginibacter jinjuensis]|uniref:Tail fiber protein n=1 Tax=Mucilaginibacter jinjuensis TaxID=1176721 RepID=A0ABY7T630_9SPHI|nr:tail fiber protein [Mucilaginibacter jinjuensis]WCT11940.1 tail fiber protein [Mucilaginibacter jinjuensis]